VHRALAVAVERWSLDLGRVLDLAAGSGEVTRGLLKLRQIGQVIGSIEAMDPYTFDLYRRRTGLPAEAISFEQIAQGGLAERRYSLVICSYALHLVEGSRLPVLAQQLSMIGAGLLVLTPNRRPEIAPAWGWIEAGRMAVEKTKVRYYRSGNDVAGQAG
jgi:hypothetical protein